jgi:hypothetical protein
MRDPEIPEFGPKLSRMMIATIIWMGIGLFTLNAISGRRVLECDRLPGIVQCHLTMKQLLAEKRVRAFDDANLQKAIITSKGMRRSMYEATLVTNHGNFWMTPMDTEQFYEKHRIVDEINAFLKNPQSPMLKIESSYSTLFWIGSGIFIAVFALLSFGVVISWRLISNAPVSERLFKGSWDIRSKSLNYEERNYSQADVQKYSQLPSTPTDSKSDI